jgi:hypothetical protein
MTLTYLPPLLALIAIPHQYQVGCCVNSVGEFIDLYRFGHNFCSHQYFGKPRSSSTISICIFASCIAASRYIWGGTAIATQLNAPTKHRMKNVDNTFWVWWLWNTKYVDFCISCLISFNYLTKKWKIWQIATSNICKHIFISNIICLCVLLGKRWHGFSVHFTNQMWYYHVVHVHGLFAIWYVHRTFPCLRCHMHVQSIHVLLINIMSLIQGRRYKDMMLYF